jgi:hypothetical protein
LAEGEKAHPANYRSCKHAKEEMRKKKPQGTPKPTTGRVFTTKLINPSVSFAAALRGHTEQNTNEEFYSLVLHPVARKDQYSINNHQSQPIPLPVFSLYTVFLFETD